jgi:predicted metal-binding protein
MSTDRDLQRWCERAVELGAEAATSIAASSVVAAEWVRRKCLWCCDEPGVYRSCPPNQPPVEATKQLLAEYERGILLEVGPCVGAERSDEESDRLNAAALALERELFLAGFFKAWTMGAGPCDRCDACSHGRPCPTPELARPSMEGCGIDVFSTVRNAGWEIEVVRDEDDAYSFFALVLVD